MDTEFKALMIINTVTNLLEIVWIDKKKSENITQRFAYTWLSLSLYPCPAQIIYNNGEEFIGHEFQDMMRSLGITSKPTKLKNPQANAIIKWLYKMMSDILQIMLHVDPPHNELETTAMINNDLVTVKQTPKYVVNHTIQRSVGTMVFNRYTDV